MHHIFVLDFEKSKKIYNIPLLLSSRVENTNLDKLCQRVIHWIVIPLGLTVCYLHYLVPKECWEQAHLDENIFECKKGLHLFSSPHSHSVFVPSSILCIRNMNAEYFGTHDEKTRKKYQNMEWDIKIVTWCMHSTNRDDQDRKK